MSKNQIKNLVNETPGFKKAKLKLYIFVFFYRYDHLTIYDDQNYEYDIYCGVMTGHTVLVNGSYVLIRFHSDDVFEEKGFLLVFTAVPIGEWEARTCTT